VRIREVDAIRDEVIVEDDVGAVVRDGTLASIRKITDTRCSGNVDASHPRR